MISGTLTYQCDECLTPQDVTLDGGYPPLEGPNWPTGWVRLEDESLELCPSCAVTHVPSP